MTEVEGKAGELIDRLIECCSVHDEHWAYSSFAMLSFQIRLLPPRRPWQQDQYRELARRRLAEIVEAGLREDLLVRAARDELGRHWQGRADVAAAEQKTAKLRDVAEHVRDNPVDYLGRLGNSVEDVRRQAAELLDSPVIQGIGADQAANRWADLERWTAAVQRLLPDSVLTRWVDQLLRRGVRGSSPNTT